MQGLRRAWSKYSQLGVTPDMTPPQAKRVMLCNQVAIVATLLSVDYILSFALFKMYSMIVLAAVAQLFYMMILVLNARGHTRLGRILLSLIGTLDISGSTLLMGARTGVHLLLFANALGPYLQFSTDERRFLRITSSISVTAFLVVELLSSSGLFPPVVTIRPSVVTMLRCINAVSAFVLMLLMMRYLHTANARTEAKLEEERGKSDRLLLNVLPQPIAERLRNGEQQIAERFESATVLFADLVDFTRLSARIQPEALVQMLNQIFSEFDKLVDRLGLEKIKTIGDAYMVVGGVPRHRSDHAHAVAELALAMRATLSAMDDQLGEPFTLRIGIHTGPVVAGVIGTRKFIYDLWGDTVNTASRMESRGLPGAIQVSEQAYLALQDRYLFEPRGELEFKGKGRLKSYLLLGTKESGVKAAE